MELFFLWVTVLVGLCWFGLCLLCGTVAFHMTNKTIIGVLVCLAALALSPVVVGLFVGIAWVCDKMGRQQHAP